MKKALSIGLLVLAAVLSFSVQALAQEEQGKNYSFSLQADVFSKYIWRGSVLTDGPVFQPSATLETGDLTLSAWFNVDLDDANEMENELSEIDLSAEYAWAYESFNMGAGIIYYTYPDTDLEDSSEVYTTVGMDVVLEPSVTLFYDFMEADGLYASFDIGHTTPSLKINENSSCEFAFNLGFGYGDSNMNEYIFGVPEDGMADLHAGVKAPISIGENLCIEPSILFSSLLDDEIKDELELDDDSEVVAGLSVCWTF
jgi:hypothetical protein